MGREVRREGRKMQGREKERKMTWRKKEGEGDSGRGKLSEKE